MHTLALRWHEVSMGALNVIHHADTPTPFLDTRSDEFRLLGQALADIAALVLVQHQKMDAAELRERVEQARTGRTITEQRRA